MTLSVCDSLGSLFAVTWTSCFTGQEEFDRLLPLSCSQTHVFLVCFNVTTPESFENVKEKWLPEVHHRCPGVPCLIVGTQIDLRDDRQVVENMARRGERPVTRELGESLAKELGAVKYVECSALTQSGLNNVFEEVRLRVYLARLDYVDVGATGHRRCSRAFHGQEKK